VIKFLDLWKVVVNAGLCAMSSNIVDENHFSRPEFCEEVMLMDDRIM
jgi:hypothetical protein